MQFDWNEEVAGVDLRTIRPMLRELETGREWWEAADLAQMLEIDTALAEAFIAALVEAGFVQMGPRRGLWQTSALGAALKNSRTRRYKREVAERALAGVLKRLEQVNREPRFLASVRRMVLFGGMLSEEPLVGEVDLAIALEPKESDLKRRYELTVARVREVAQAKGYDWERAVAYVMAEPVRHLQGRSRIVNLMDMGQLVALLALRDFPVQVLYVAPDLADPARARADASMMYFGLLKYPPVADRDAETWRRVVTRITGCEPD